MEIGFLVLRLRVQIYNVAYGSTQLFKEKSRIMNSFVKSFHYYLIVKLANSL